MLHMANKLYCGVYIFNKRILLSQLLIQETHAFGGHVIVGHESALFKLFSLLSLLQLL